MSIELMELPPGWEWSTMGEIADVVSGGTPKTNEPSNYEGGTIPWLTPADLSGYTAKTIGHGARYITQKGLDTSSAKMMPAGTVLFTSRAPIGYVAIASNPVCTNQGFKSFVLKDGVLPDYAYWWLKGSKNLAESLASGTTFLELSGAKAKQIPIPIAPLDQQQCIVAEIEKQFSRLDEAVANLKRVKANFKRYKAAVLKAAVEGRLVADDASPGKPEWERNPIGVAVESLDQGWSPQCENQSAQCDDDWAVMKTTAVQPLKYLQAENKRLPNKLVPRAHLELIPGDLLITRAGPRSRVGVACLVKATRPRIMLCDKVYRLRTKQDVALPAYMELVLNSPDVVESINELKTGISDSGVNLTQKRFQELLIPIPPVSKQERILSEVDRSLSLSGETEALVDANLQRANRLRSSILSAAFSGGADFKKL